MASALLNPIPLGRRCIRYIWGEAAMALAGQPLGLCHDRRLGTRTGMLLCTTARIDGVP